MRHLRNAALAGLLLSTPGYAQTVGGTVDVSVPSGSGSAAVGLPATLPNYSAVVLTPASGTTIDIRFKIGGSSVLATSTSAVLPPGGICFNPGPNAYISAYGVSGTATLHVTQYSQCPQGIGFAGGGGGGGGGAVTQSGIWTVQPGNTANTTPWLVTANGNVSNASSAVASTSTNIGSNSYLYAWNGTSWDQALSTSGYLGTYIQGCATSVCNAFTQSAIATPISATTGGATGTLPTGASVLVVNKGATYPATCTLGASDSGAAYYIPAAQTAQIGVPASATQITCTGIGGTATINLIGGSGSFAGAGGGGGGSGSIPTGTAGSPNAAVLTVQGITGATGISVSQGPPNSAANAWPTSLTIGGAAVTSSNPLPAIVPNTWATGTSNNGLIQSAVTLMSSELNSLANGTTSAWSTTVFTNAAGTSGTAQAQVGDIVFTSGGSFTPVAGQVLDGWFMKSSDGGSTFEFSGVTAGTVAPPRAPDFIIPLPAATVSSPYQFWSQGTHAVKIPAYKFHVLLLNPTITSGVNLPSTGNTLQLVSPLANN